MAIRHGSQGDVLFTSAGTLYEELDAHIRAWSANFLNDEFDDTDFNQADEGKSVYMGMYTVRGSCQAFLDSIVNVQAASWASGRDAETLRLTASTGEYWEFEAKADNFGWLVNKGTGLNVLTFDFVSEGDITTFGT